MELDDYYTNELLLEKFSSQFSLVNYAIRLAKRRLRTGPIPDLYSENQNVSYDVLNAILEGTDQEMEVAEPVAEVVEEVVAQVVEPEKTKVKRELKRVQLRKARPLKMDSHQDS